MSKRWLKNIIIKICSESSLPVLVTHNKSIFNSTQKILLLRYDRLGDVIVTVPFLRELSKNSINKFEIDCLFSYKNIVAKPAFENYIYKALLLERGILKIIKIIREIRKYKYDLIIDLTDNASSTSNIILKLSGAKYKLGFQKENSNVYTHIVETPPKLENHIIKRLLNLLKSFNAFSEDIDLSLEYPISKELEDSVSKFFVQNNKKRMGVIYSGSNLSKSLGNEKLKIIIKKLNNDFADWDIYLFRTKDMVSISDELIKETNMKAAPLSSNFNEFAASIKQMDYILTPDTVSVHLASAFNIPCLALFTFLNDERYGMPWIPLHSKGDYLTVNSKKLDDIDENLIYERIKKSII